MWWSYVPHFINTPGYVYAYAYGQLLALSVYSRYLRGGRVVRAALPRAARRRRLAQPRGAGRDRRYRPRRPRLLGRGSRARRASSCRGRGARGRESLSGERSARARALLLALDHVDDQLHHLLDPGRLRVAVLERLAPVADVTLGRELVEVRARHRSRAPSRRRRCPWSPSARAARPGTAADRRARAARARRRASAGWSAGTSSRNRLTAVSISDLVSAGRGAQGAEAQILWRSSSLRPITIRWISDVPSPISSSGASR